MFFGYFLQISARNYSQTKYFSICGYFCGGGKAGGYCVCVNCRCRVPSWRQEWGDCSCCSEKEKYSHTYKKKSLLIVIFLTTFDLRKWYLFDHRNPILEVGRFVCMFVAQSPTALLCSLESTEAKSSWGLPASADKLFFFFYLTFAPLHMAFASCLCLVLAVLTLGLPCTDTKRAEFCLKQPDQNKSFPHSSEFCAGTQCSSATCALWARFYFLVLLFPRPLPSLPRYFHVWMS